MLEISNNSTSKYRQHYIVWQYYFSSNVFFFIFLVRQSNVFKSNPLQTMQNSSKHKGVHNVFDMPLCLPALRLKSKRNLEGH